MRKSFLFICAGFLVSLCTARVAAQPQLARWDFSRQDSLLAVEEISKASFAIVSNFQKPEYVKGIAGDGLRLDGYSSYVKGGLVKPVNVPFSATGWFALETFPTDTAGFFALADATGKNWISATVDLFGRPLIGISSEGRMRYISGAGSIQKFRWFQVALSVSRESVALWIDKQRVAEVSVNFNNVSFQEIYLGRDQREKLLHNYFPVTCLNGIIDEITIVKGVLNEAAVVSNFNNYESDVKPHLAIPTVRFENDFNRPGYHLLPGANWTNETHGLIYYKGKYHLFNQKNGTNLYLGQINWGHFSSEDLIHWTEHKPALAPEYDYDRIGIWSGHAVIDNDGKPAIMYTGSNGKHTGMNLAYAKDDALIEWEKYKNNPVVDGPPAGFTRKDMRDPYLWKEGNAWYMIIGYGVVEGNIEKGSVILYKSDDLKNWKFIHELFTGAPQVDDSGIFWEMPVFWKLNNKYILLVNKVPQPGKPAVALYWTGNFKNEKFVPDHKIPKKLELINRLLSPSVTTDEQGRTVAIAIIPDETSAMAQLKQGWTHLYSIPRLWSLKNGKLCQQPLPELSKLRGDRKTLGARTLNSGEHLQLSSSTHQTEIAMKLKPADCSVFGIELGKNTDGSELTRIYFDVVNGKIVVDSKKSTTREFIPTDVRTASFKIDPNTEVDLHIFIDGSVIEVFINNEDAFTTRIFPEKESSNIVELYSEGGKLQLQHADVWQLRSSENTFDY